MYRFQLLSIIAAMLPPFALAQTPVVSTVAGVTASGGAPERGVSGDGGPATSAALALANLQNECDPQRFEQNSFVTVDANGNLYFSDSNNQRIRKIDAQGVIATVAGSGTRAATDSRCEAINPATAAGPAKSALLYNPSGIALHPNGNLIIADQQNNVIRQITPAGTISTIAGNGTHNLYAPGIPATSSPMDWPSGVAVDSNGVVYFAELHGNRVAKIGTDGRLATVAGNGFPGFNADGISATSAQLKKPSGIAIDAVGNLYIADSANFRIRKVTPDGIIQTIAGTGQQGFAGDGGSAARAMLSTPMDVKVDAAGNVYIADAGNQRIRRVDRQGIITTIAGTGDPGRGPDFADAAQSSLNFPSALAFGPNGDLFVVDWQNYLIRKISFAGGPALTPGGIVNGASFEFFPAPVAPGSIVAIFGANLSTDTAVASGAPWPKQLAGTSIEVNGAAIPLYSVSPGQLTGQLPYDLQEGAVTAVAKVAARGGTATSNSVTLNIAPVATGIFQFSGSTRAAALNQDGITVNSPQTPEVRGNVVVVFLTGQGAVTLPVSAGDVAPADALARAIAPASATIGGVPADIQFFGLTPGSIGLAQINLVVPFAVVSGDAIPVVLQVGGRKSNSATIAIR